MADIQTKNLSGQGGTAQKNDGELDDALEKINRVFKEKAAAEKAKTLGLPYLAIAATPVNPDLLKIVAEEQAKKAMVMPFSKSGKKIKIAVADPEKPETKSLLGELQKQGYEVELHLATEEGILESHRLYVQERYVKRELITKSEDRKTYEKEVEMLSGLKEKIESVSADEALNLIEVSAMKAGASDIHYEPQEKFVRVRFRIDGVLHKVFDLSSHAFENIANQIKYRAKMKLNVKTVPQDGRYSFVLNERRIDVRVSAIPVEYGETFVLRLLDTGKQFLGFEEIGFMDSALEKAKKVLQLAHGMVLVTGPTGSGKTTTLYSFLTQLNRPDVKIITLEDPIEYHIEGIAQSQINEKKGYDFSNGLRAVLRQDPDIVMLGEIRDLETANTAAQAALTGHLLLSTLHTNSAIESVPRLVNMGLPEFMIAPALHTIIAQRLVRRICEGCKKLEPISTSDRETLEKKLAAMKTVRPDLNLTIPEKLPMAEACENCSNTGYRGQIAILEILTMDDELKELILNKSSTAKLTEASRKKGMLTMEEDGIAKVLKGVTTLSEVYRVVSADTSRRSSQ